MAAVPPRACRGRARAGPKGKEERPQGWCARRWRFLFWRQEEARAVDAAVVRLRLVLQLLVSSDASLLLHLAACSDLGGSSIVEDAQCPRLQDLIEVNHDMSKINFEMDCLPSEIMNLLLSAGEMAYDINTNRKEETSDVVEGMELTSSVTTQDVLMSSPEKNIPSQNNMSQEEEPNVFQSVFDNKSLTTECPLLDSPGLSCSQLVTFVQRGERAKHVSFGGNLIAFSPLRPLGTSRKYPEETSCQKN
ncbi:disks large-associated protein 5-like isoform X8 [Saccopteryx bilineata]|uniref:disks large-associated protein 5-like isoform X8 n=1 Tax=Saccopteryx bilineata TaxID=59482 RepID=UPI00338F923E